MRTIRSIGCSSMCLLCSGPFYKHEQWYSETQTHKDTWSDVKPLLGNTNVIRSHSPVGSVLWGKGRGDSSMSDRILTIIFWSNYRSVRTRFVRRGPEESFLVTTQLRLRPTTMKELDSFISGLFLWEPSHVRMEWNDVQRREVSINTKNV